MKLKSYADQEKNQICPHGWLLFDHIFGYFTRSFLFYGPKVVKKNKIFSICALLMNVKK